MGEIPFQLIQTKLNVKRCDINAGTRIFWKYFDSVLIEIEIHVWGNGAFQIEISSAVGVLLSHPQDHPGHLRENWAGLLPLVPSQIVVGCCQQPGAGDRAVPTHREVGSGIPSHTVAGSTPLPPGPPNPSVCVSYREKQTGNRERERERVP